MSVVLGTVRGSAVDPGEDGIWDEQESYFPDYVSAGESAKRGEWRGPRPTVVQVTRKS